MSYSSNPYNCYVNGTYKGRVGGNQNLEVTAPTGNITVKTVQVSGYLFSPSEFTGSGTLGKCEKTSFSFP
jgi:hypothetical protein